ncbi:MAG: type I glyceraldehyde-3-phosphate dehydrogenase [Rhodospirillaceae bacterium TMED167]|nr:type I glyceraldehyde-3-phosphate dehydrogenase [Rhodospirillaceae bacterium]OUW23275.1 MAG: type I glyceraldehyde-3-phosphate dehydrogenase [Rhodospirillaceae bacterium TMED167]
MTTRVGINGLGRIGRLALRVAWDWPDLDIVHINEPHGDPEVLAHLLEFDSVHGRWDRDISWQSSYLQVSGKNLSISAYSTPAEIPWSAAGVDIVIEASGEFRTRETLSAHLAGTPRKVIVAAPVKEEDVLNIVMGVNDWLYNPATHDIVTAASCTTNCLAPVVKVIHENIGITHGSITTVHNVTNTQVMVDGPHKDLRRARSGLTSLIPTTTGSATAITLIYPDLKGKLDGHAIRVPLLNASLTDCVFEVKRVTSADEVNQIFRNASKTELNGILGLEDRPLVSVDYTNDSRSSIIDGPSTLVINGTQVKIYAWYDNEWGYVNRMVDLAMKIAATL